MTYPILSRRQLLHTGLACSAMLGFGPARAQAAWPTKAVRFVVPFAPGGSSEIVARATAVELGKLLGQSVYVDNKPGGAGNGSAGHLAFEYLKATANVFMVHVPYKGTGPQLTDLLSGRLEAAAVGASAILQHIKAGKLRCIATGSTRRLPQLPEVPTVAEQGFPGFEMTQWYGMLAPASMAQANIDRLAAETVKAIKSPAAVERLSGDAAEAVGNTPAQFAQFIAAEQKRWKSVVERAKIKAD